MSLVKTVLVVEDEAEIRELISIHLLRHQFQVVAVVTAEEASAVIKQKNFDLMIVDWMLPQMSGLDFIKHVKRQHLQMPILMLTAKAEAPDIVSGLESGADDYLTKPFDPQILIARAKALLRRTEWQQNSNGGKANESRMVLGELVLDCDTYEVIAASEKLHLTPSEFKLLQTLVKSAGKVLSREHLIDQVQGEGISVVGRTIDTHVFGLRKKLGPCSDYIETIRGIGYRIKAPHDKH